MRTFIGIQIPEYIRENLKEVIEKVKKVREAKPVRLENLHITLKFLGEIKKDQLDFIKKKLEKCAEEFESFDVEIKGVGVFPSEKNVRVLWIGVEDNGSLKKLNSKIEDVLKEFGFEKERAFVSHITTARFRSFPNLSLIKEIIEKYKEKTFGKFTVKDFYLYESELKTTGPIYKKLEKFELK
ncbi:MAG: RNA 2',3'-cyclic phosphodiesterase [Candidatus Omnitrophica bacterium]|nr:RNA 2',3'-cyclic phosphodiesterase [Candidatus Omnitrophota bacterium]